MNTTTHTAARPLFNSFSIDELDEMTLSQMLYQITRYTTIITWLREEALPTAPTERACLAIITAFSRLETIRFFLQSRASARARWTTDPDEIALVTPYTAAEIAQCATHTYQFAA